MSFKPEMKSNRKLSLTFDQYLSTLETFLNNQKNEYLVKRLIKYIQIKYPMIDGHGVLSNRMSDRK